MSTETLENTETNLDGSTVPEPAAPASSESGDASGPDLSVLADEYGADEETIKEFINGDDNFAKLVNEAANDSDKSSEDGHADDKSAENSAADSETKDKAAKDTEDKNSGADGGEALEFADDVIKGFKGEDFGKLSEDSQNALANFYEEAQAKAAKFSEYEARLNGLMGDPVINARAAAIESGRSADLQVRGLNAQDEASIINALKEKGFEGDEASDILSAFRKGIGLAAQDMAQDMANRAIVASDTQRQDAEINKQGNEILLSLSQYNKDLALNEKDISKFWILNNGKWELNSSHPEIEKFKNGLGKISQWAGETGIDYKKLVKMGGKAFYAAAAAALDMPVVMNAAERDKKIVADTRRKALAPFLKSAKSNTLDTQSGSVEAAKKAAAAAKVIHNGINVEKLVTDRSYYEAQVSKCWGDVDKLDKLEALVEKGRESFTRKK